MIHLLNNYLFYFGVFIFGFISAVLFFNYNIKKLLSDNFSHYKETYREKYGGFSLIYFGVLKILKERKDYYKGETESKIINTKELSNSSVSGREIEISQFPNTNENPQNFDKAFYDEKVSPTIDLTLNSRQEDFNSKNEKKLNVLYFSAPEQDGSFLLDNSSSTAASRSYYKIEFFEDENIGKLIYRSGILDKSALSQMDFILSPVCDIENSSMTNPSIVNVESHGSVIQENNSWRISKKIKIKLS